MALTASRRRVVAHTSRARTAGIRQAMRARLRTYARHPDRIDARLAELDREWDVERTLQANASSLALAGLGLGAFVDRRFYALPAVVSGFLLQHALQGWCPPLPLFRRLGYRTAAEIEAERHALLALRGAYRDATDGDRTPEARVEAALSAAGCRL